MGDLRKETGVQVTLMQRSDDLWLLEVRVLHADRSVVRETFVHEPSLSVEKAVEIADAISPDVGLFVRRRLAEHAEEREQHLAHRHEEMERTARNQREEIARVAARASVSRGWADRFPPPHDFNQDDIPF